MREEDTQFAQLMEQVRAGSQEAVRALLDLYGHHIYRAVRRRLNQQLRARYDSEDFVQAVWATFFANLQEISGFEQPGALIAFLARVASNKVVDEYRRCFATQKNDIRRERRMGSADGVSRAVRQDPTPSALASANEQFDRLVQEQPDHYRRIVELRASGHTYEEIARQLGLNERTVRRVLRKLQQRAGQ